MPHVKVVWAARPRTGPHRAQERGPGLGSGPVAWRARAGCVPSPREGGGGGGVRTEPLSVSFRAFLPGIATTSRLGCGPSGAAASSLLLTCGGWGGQCPGCQACCGPGRCEGAGEAEEKTVRSAGNWRLLAWRLRGREPATDGYILLLGFAFLMTDLFVAGGCRGRQDS